MWLNKGVIFDFNAFPVSLLPPLNILLSFTTLFSAMNMLASFCRDARDSNLPVRLGWTDSYFLSLLFNAGLPMKQVTVQRIGTGTQVINACVWNRAENIWCVYLCDYTLWKCLCMWCMHKLKCLCMSTTVNSCVFNTSIYLGKWQLFL